MDCLSGDGLVLLGALAAIQLAHGKCSEEVELLAAFFTIVGDNLALLGLTLPSREDCLTGSDTPPEPVFVP